MPDYERYISPGFHMPDDPTDHEWLLHEARKRSEFKRDENHKREDLVASEIERRRVKMRRKKMNECYHTRSLNADKTDMTFWLTRVGPKLMIGITPEEMKGIRSKTMGELENDKNVYHVRAREGHMYWPKRDDRHLLSHCVMKPPEDMQRKIARLDGLHLSSSTTLGSFMPDWKNFTF